MSDFVLRCSCCGSYYAVPRTGGLRQVDYLPRGPRCINTMATGQMCGAPLTRGSLRRGAREVAAGDLLGWTVTRPAPSAPAAVAPTPVPVAADDTWLSQAARQAREQAERNPTAYSLGLAERLEAERDRAD